MHPCFKRTHEFGPTLPSNIQCKYVNEEGIEKLLDEEADPENLIAGDFRATEQPGLTSLHSLFLNEHNRIAKNISQLYSLLSDDDIYQMARQIVIAELQNIVYNEFLPVVLGSTTMEQYNIKLPIHSTSSRQSITTQTPASTISTSTPTPTSMATSYLGHVNPTAFNEFATFAFRFGHSMVPKVLKPNRNPENCPIKDNFFDFEEFVLGTDFSGKAWEDLLHGISNTESPPFDAVFNKHLTNFLFCGDNCKTGVGFGQDLAARNIQRGRDHGLPGYVYYREYCGLTKPTDWNDKPEDISPENWKNLESVYSNVEDIDAFSGAFSENSLFDGLVGPTIACILGQQFKNLMDGDRFFFTHSRVENSFGQGLADNVKAMVRLRKLSDIMCDNLDMESVR